MGRRSRFLGVGLGKAAQLSEVSIREHVQGLGISLVRYTHTLQLLSYCSSGSKCSLCQGTYLGDELLMALAAVAHCNLRRSRWVHQCRLYIKWLIPTDTLASQRNTLDGCVSHLKGCEILLAEAQ